MSIERDEMLCLALCAGAVGMAFFLSKNKNIVGKIENILQKVELAIGEQSAGEGWKLGADDNKPRFDF